MWKRSWFRWTVRCVALLLLAIFSITFYYRWRGENELAEARKEFESKVGPLDSSAYQPKPVREEDNGAVWLLAGAQAVVVFQSERVSLRSLAETPSSRWTEEQVALAERLLERNAPALALLRRSVGMQAYSLEAANSDEGRHGLKLLIAARLLAADSRDALRQGHTDRFFSGAEVLRVLSSAQESNAKLIDLILGTYSERLLLPVLQEAASSPVLGPATHARIDELVPRANLLDAWRNTLGMEAAETELRMTETTGMESSSEEPTVWSRIISWMTGDADHAYYLRLWVQTISWAREPYAHTPSTPPRPPRLLPWSVIGSIQTSSLRGASGRLQATLALRALTSLGLGIRQVGVEKGAYPADLLAFPSAQRPDPFTGKPLDYKLNADGSATLMAPDAEALYKKVTGGKGAVVRFTWTLPTLAPGVPTPSSGLSR